MTLAVGTFVGTYRLVVNSSKQSVEVYYKPVYGILSSMRINNINYTNTYPLTVDGLIPGEGYSLSDRFITNAVIYRFTVPCTKAPNVTDVKLFGSMQTNYVYIKLTPKTSASEYELYVNEIKMTVMTTLPSMVNEDTVIACPITFTNTSTTVNVRWFLKNSFGSSPQQALTISNSYLINASGISNLVWDDDNPAYPFIRLRIDRCSVDNGLNKSAYITAYCPQRKSWIVPIKLSDYSESLHITDLYYYLYVTRCDTVYQNYMIQVGLTFSSTIPSSWLSDANAIVSPTIYMRAILLPPIYRIVGCFFHPGGGQHKYNIWFEPAHWNQIGINADTYIH
jgi:hypothetical protein